MSRTSTGSSWRPSPVDPDPLRTVPESASEVRRTLDALGVRPSKRWGQSFLTDPFVADAEAALLELPLGRPIVEIGGGLGILTAAIRRRGLGPLTVLERDPRLADFLRRTFGPDLDVRTADARTAELPPAEAVIGNLPYSVATPILRRLFEARVPRVVFLVQREVAERIAAGPGTKEYGRLSIWARFYGRVELFRTVGPASFSPRPEVESRLAVHVAREGPLPTGVRTLERIVDVAFSSRRKQLGNLLPRLFSSSEAADRRVRAAGWPDDWRRRRAEELPPEAFFDLGRAIEAADTLERSRRPGRSAPSEPRSGSS